MADPFIGSPPPPGGSQPGAGSRLPWVIAGLTFVIGVLATALVMFLLLGNDEGLAAGSAGYELLYEPPDDEGPDAFMSIADRVDLTGTTAPAAATTDPSESGITPLPDEVGLFGGSLEQTCDAEVLVAYLGTEPEKAQAWAGVHGITVEQIPAYVGNLTAAILRVDTRVTNHGFSGGVATPRQSVLPAGTAVLADPEGRARVRCNCGNPLREPRDPGRPCPTTSTRPTTTTTTTTIIDRTTTTSTRPTTTTTIIDRTTTTLGTVPTTTTLAIATTTTSPLTFRTTTTIDPPR